MEKEPQKTHRISGFTAFMMIGVAAILDVVAIVLAVLSFGTAGAVLTAVEGVIFSCWFTYLKVPLLSPKAFVRSSLSFLGDIASAGLLPAITLGVILVISITRAEDRLGIDVLSKVSTKPGVRNLSMKEARRAASPEKALEARARLQRRLNRQSEGGVLPFGTPKERPQMKDIDYPKAA